MSNATGNVRLGVRSRQKRNTGKSLFTTRQPAPRRALRGYRKNFRHRTAPGKTGIKKYPERGHLQIVRTADILKPAQTRPKLPVKTASQHLSRTALMGRAGRRYPRAGFPPPPALCVSISPLMPPSPVGLHSPEFLGQRAKLPSCGGRVAFQTRPLVRVNTGFSRIFAIAQAPSD